MSISERDIFNFVFAPHLLDDEKKEAVSKNFPGDVHFYKELKKGKEDFPEEIKYKIKEKIPAYNLLNSVKLFPYNENKIKKRKDRPTLAAGSAALKENLIVTTFFDEQKKFISRLLVENDQSKLYIFSTEEEVLNNLKIKMLPSKREYFMENNSSPLLFQSSEKIESIEISFDK
jgi:hypothetical protein